MEIMEQMAYHQLHGKVWPVPSLLDNQAYKRLVVVLSDKFTFGGWNVNMRSKELFMQVNSNKKKVIKK